MDKDAGDAANALAAQHAELAGLLQSLAVGDWDRPTRCPGWSVSDVVLHLAQTDEMSIASLEGRTAGFIAERTAGPPGGGPGSVSDGGPGGGPGGTVDDGAALMVARERGAPFDQVLSRWRAASGTLDEMLEGADPHRRVVWVVGELSIRTLITTRLAEAWIHGGDIAEAVGAEVKADDRLRHIARLAWRTLPYAFAREGRELSGPVAFELVGPSGEQWRFIPENPPATVVRGEGAELCLVAARRVDPSATGLTAEGPDADAVLSLVRTYA
jgi:uncharacterized protein (TIGR03084 family)